MYEIITSFIIFLLVEIQIYIIYYVQNYNDIQIYIIYYVQNYNDMLCTKL